MNINDLRKELSDLVENNPLIQYREKQIEFAKRVRAELLDIYNIHPYRSDRTIIVTDYSERRILVSAIEEYKQLIEEEKKHGSAHL